jgi:hypothetical protein
LPASGRWILWFAHVLVGEPASTSPEHALAIEYLPPASSGGRSSHKSETRISAIADFARKGKREKKALPLSLLTDLRRMSANGVVAERVVLISNILRA